VLTYNYLSTQKKY